MRVFCQELKKILNWKILLILLIFTALYYSLFLRNGLFHNYTDNVVAIEIMTAVEKKYGPEISTGEQQSLRKDFDAFLVKTKSQVNQIIASKKEFQNIKVKNLDQFQALQEKDAEQAKKDSAQNTGHGVREIDINGPMKRDDTLSQLLWESFPPQDKQDLPGKKATPYMLYQVAMEKKDMITDAGKESPQLAPRGAGIQMNPRQAGRIRQIINRGWRSALPHAVYNGSCSLTSYLAILLLFSIAILISPALVKERRSGVRSLAYTCRKGRSVFGVRFAAAIAAAVLTVLVQLAVFLILYFAGPHRVDLPFFGCDISNSIDTALFFWHDMTFGQLFFWRGLIMSLIAFGFGLFTFAVSCHIRNYVTAFAVVIPSAVGLSILCRWLFTQLFFISIPQDTEGYLCLAIVLVPSVICLLLNHHEKTADILT